jgi:hypothetical protein
MDSKPPVNPAELVLRGDLHDAAMQGQIQAVGNRIRQEPEAEEVLAPSLSGAGCLPAIIRHASAHGWQVIRP